MGCLLDPTHPVFENFPTEFHSNWQWWTMCQGRAIVLPKGVTSLVKALDCYAYMRNMGMLVEAQVGNGRLMISSMGLMENMQYPEVKALTQCILNYMTESSFSPTQILEPEIIRDLVK